MGLEALLHWGGDFLRCGTDPIRFWPSVLDHNSKSVISLPGDLDRHMICTTRNQSQTLILRNQFEGFSFVRYVL
jgi:hypothetical protein